MDSVYLLGFESRLRFHPQESTLLHTPSIARLDTSRAERASRVTLILGGKRRKGKMWIALTLRDSESADRFHCTSVRNIAMHSLVTPPNTQCIRHEANVTLGCGDHEKHPVAFAVFPSDRADSVDRKSSLQRSFINCLSAPNISEEKGAK